MFRQVDYEAPLGWLRRGIANASVTAEANVTQMTPTGRRPFA
jgi:hypothetical protein